MAAHGRCSDGPGIHVESARGLNDPPERCATCSPESPAGGFAGAAVPDPRNRIPNQARLLRTASIGPSWPCATKDPQTCIGNRQTFRGEGSNRYPDDAHVTPWPRKPRIWRAEGACKAAGSRAIHLVTNLLGIPTHTGRASLGYAFGRGPRRLGCAMPRLRRWGWSLEALLVPSPRFLRGEKVR